jgi:hypothetical protein
MNRSSRELDREPFAIAPQAFLSVPESQAHIGPLATLNPNQVKQREHVGIGAIVSGSLFVLIGLLLAFISWSWAAAAITFGVIALVGGGAVLTRIPDMLSTPQQKHI